MNVTPLYPSTAGSLPLKGLRLRERLPAPLLYSNFVTSLDGRIALGGPDRQTHSVPKETSNSRDWRLYQELGAQADVLITSGSLFRQIQNGEVCDVLPIGLKYEDLRQWRTEHDLNAQPDIAIISGSLDLPLDTLVGIAKDRRVRVLTGAQAAWKRKAALRDAGIDVIEAGAGARVEGQLLRDALVALGAQRMYSIAGPQVLHMLLAARVLDRLYLTLAGRVLGGAEFDTLCIGPTLEPAPKLKLADLHLDPEAPDGAGQLLATYDIDYD